MSSSYQKAIVRGFRFAVWSEGAPFPSVDITLFEPWADNPEPCRASEYRNYVDLNERAAAAADTAAAKPMQQQQQEKPDAVSPKKSHEEEKPKMRFKQVPQNSVVVNVFRTGKMLCKGSKSMYFAQKAMKLIATRMRYVLGIEGVVFRDFRVSNIGSECVKLSADPYDEVQVPLFPVLNDERLGGRATAVEGQNFIRFHEPDDNIYLTLFPDGRIASKGGSSVAAVLAVMNRVAAIMIEHSK